MNQFNIKYYCPQRCFYRQNQNQSKEAFIKNVRDYLTAQYERTTVYQKNLDDAIRDIGRIKAIKDPVEAFNECSALRIRLDANTMFVELRRKFILSIFKGVTAIAAALGTAPDIVAFAFGKSISLGFLLGIYDLMSSKLSSHQRVLKEICEEKQQKLLEYGLNAKYESMDAPVFKELINNLQIEMNKYIQAKNEEKVLAQQLKDIEKTTPVDEKAKFKIEAQLGAVKKQIEVMDQKYKNAMAELDAFHERNKRKYRAPQTYSWMYVYLDKIRSLPALSKEEKSYLYPPVNKMEILYNYYRQSPPVIDEFAQQSWDAFNNRLHEVVEQYLK